ncbi:MAG: hypothetical protein IH609_01845 [Dehalococcoidia bacterium]|nr:hypothetical protein [Dehalococcoidia bacterium]
MPRGPARNADTGRAALTERQQEVLGLMARGLTNGEIAQRLGITLDGAKWHVAEVMRKLDASSREEAVAVWRSGRSRWHGAALLVPAAVGSTVAVAIFAVVVFVLREGTGTEDVVSSLTPTAPSTPTPQPPHDVFEAVGPPSVTRNIHGAALLPDGRVLLAGGNNISGQPVVHDSIEIFDTLTDQFTDGGRMLTARQAFTPVVLDDGRVLLAGGVTETGATTAAEIYDPVTRRSEPTGSMAVPRVFYGVATLDDGRVLIIGGGIGADRVTAEAYDPATGTFAAIGSVPGMTEAEPKAVTVGGRIFVFAGQRDWEFDPAAGEFRQIDAPDGLTVLAPLPELPTVLPDGLILLTGGVLPQPGADPRAPHIAQRSAALFDPQSGDVVWRGSMSVPRTKHQAVLLDDGRVLIAGGTSDTQLGVVYESAEIFDPVTRTFSPAVSMLEPRVWHSMTRLPDGRVLVVGTGRQPHVSGGDLYYP